MGGKPRVRVDREHQLWGWPGRLVCAYQRRPSVRDKPYSGVRQQWIICHLPFARDWKIESIQTNLRTYRVVLSHGAENLELDDVWVDWWLKVSTHARTQDALDRAAAGHGYARVTPGSALR